MEIAIKQIQLNLGSDYLISIDKEESHTAISEAFWIFSKIQLHKKDNQEPILIIKRKWNWFNAKYLISFPNQEKVEFKTVSVTKNHYECLIGSDKYEIFGHIGRKYSIFKNNSQIGWWDKEKISWFGDDCYRILVDNDCNKELVISFCLTVDDFHNRNLGENYDNVVAINLGDSVTGQARVFNQNWKPKK